MARRVTRLVASALVAVAIPAAAHAQEAEAIESMDVAGDSICKGFNGPGRFPCPFADRESFNWATSLTHRDDLCAAGAEGVMSHAERLECARGSKVVAAFPNHAASGADMLHDFVNQAGLARQFLVGQPAPRYLPVLLGHNDLCGGEIVKHLGSCPGGADQDPDNHCRTRPAAFERELRKGLDVLITVPDTRIGVAAIVRVSQLCTLGAKRTCVGVDDCRSLWKAVAYSAWIFGRANGICGSLTVSCSPARIRGAYRTAKAYRDVLERVADEYARLAPGESSPVVSIAGQTVGGATKASGTTIAYSDAPWRYKFTSALLNCCDCYHPSPAGQNTLSRILFDGLTCSAADPCCRDTGDDLLDGQCAATDTDGTFYPGMFPSAPQPLTAGFK
jgi:hypothetical protein